MIYALLSFFSLLDVVFNLSQKFATASQLPLKGIFQGIKLVCDYCRHSGYLLTDWPVAGDFDKRPRRHGCGADAGV
jgi:hypothetical protein